MTTFELQNTRTHIQFGTTSMGVVGVIRSRQSYRVLFSGIIVPGNIGHLEGLIALYFNKTDTERVTTYLRSLKGGEHND